MKGTRFEQSIVIEASPEKIWENIRDFSDSSWNTFYSDTRGVFELGEAVEGTLTIDGINPVPFSATVLSCVPGELVEYETLVFGGGIRALRYIEIHAEGPSRSRVVNGEVVSGPLKFLSPKKVGDAIVKGLGTLNQALKARCEVQSIKQEERDCSSGQPGLCDQPTPA